MEKGQPLDLRKVREAATAAEPVAKTPLEKLTPRTITVPVTYVDPNGKKHKTDADMTILSGDDRFRVAKVCADFLAGATWDATPPAARDRAYMLAWLTFCLTDPPEWLLTWIQEDAVLLAELYHVAGVHESRYFRTDPAAGSGAPERPHILVASPFAAGAETK